VHVQSLKAQHKLADAMGKTVIFLLAYQSRIGSVEKMEYGICHNNSNQLNL
jgi:hypothetical protein